VFHELLFDFDFDFVCWIDWGRHRHSSLSMSHTLQSMALATKAALRFLHLSRRGGIKAKFSAEFSPPPWCLGG